MRAEDRPLRRYCGNLRAARMTTGKAAQLRRTVSLLRRPFTQPLQELCKFAFGRLLQFIEEGLLPFRSFEISAISISEHEAVVRSLTAWLELHRSLQQRDRFRVMLFVQTYFGNCDERFRKIGPQLDRP